VIAANMLTVADAVTDWLTYGLTGVARTTRDNYAVLARTNILPALGARRLRDLTATDVDRWLVDKARTLNTRTLRLLHSILNRAINRAVARDKVRRNVVTLCGIPQGQDGRPSKSLTLEQAKTLLAATADSSLHAYIVVSLLTGARTEELRPLTWANVDLDGRPDNDPPIPPSIRVWHSVRAGGDTKTKKSRRTLALPDRCVTALRQQHDRQRGPGGDQLVFPSAVGTELDRHNVLRAFRQSVKQAGLDPNEWTPRSYATASCRYCPTAA
jgi:integrase